MKGLPSNYQDFIYKSRYSRWLDKKHRREHWNETVARFFNFFREHLEKSCEFELKIDTVKELESAILNLEIMPSMRALMTAGIALRRDHVAGYNCAYLEINKINSFSEMVYILMCGTGVGFSVERDHVSKLPLIPNLLKDDETNVIVVPDSKIGWAISYRKLIHELYSGKISKFDVRNVRPKGARLKTFGGRASGPKPLVELFEYTIKVFKGAKGRRLRALEVYDLCCKIADIVVCGGFRRSALICLYSPEDEEMRLAKTGDWWVKYPHRTSANNSIRFTKKPGVKQWNEIWKTVAESGCGEPGIVNGEALMNKVTSLGRRDSKFEFGCNPCSEVILRDCEFCNLTEVVVREDDDLLSLKRKIRMATIIGTWQSTLCGFRFLNNKWKTNCEQEALLGVSLTGIMDNKFMNGTVKYKNENGKEFELKEILTELRAHAVKVNKEWAKKLQIQQAAAITTIKPSGTVSQLVSCASGIHAQHSPYYIRRVRIDKKDSIGQFLINSGVPYENDCMKPENQYVFSFPVKAPPGSIFKGSKSSLEQLKFVDIYNKYWCEHKVSVTINVKKNEWDQVGKFVFENWDSISGIAFFPHSEHIYKQAPYEEISEDEYLDLVKKMPKELDWNKLSMYEKEDNTISGNGLACNGNGCELVDLISE